MEEEGDLYLDRYEGWYSVRDEAYYEEEELSLAEDGASSRRMERPSNGQSRKAGFSGCPNTSSHCLTIMRPIPDLSAGEPRATKSCASSKAA